MKTAFLIASALAAAGIAAPAAAAPFVGDTVTCSGIGSGLDCSAVSAVVGSGLEFGINFSTDGTLLGADFSEGLLTIRNANNPEYPDGVGFPAGYGLQFSSSTTPFTVASLGTLSDVFGLDSSKINLTNGLLTIDLNGVDFLPGAFFEVNFSENVAAVPEPATWAMMILGFGVVGYAMRRRKVTFASLKTAA